MTYSSEDLPEFLRHLSRIAAKETLPRFRSNTDVINKGIEAGQIYDPVTDADREAERQIRLAIETAFPDDAILGEEHGEKSGVSGHRWVIDPIDGTRAFICGAPVWTTLIGYEMDGIPISGLISQPFTGENWIAVPDHPTIYDRNGTSYHAHVSGEENLATARIMITDTRAGEYLSKDESDVLLSLTRKCRLCRQGLDSYGFALLASGQLDLVVEAALNWHDIAAVNPVVKGAGGVAVTWQGHEITPDFPGGRVILAASQKLAEDVVDLLRDIPLA